MRNFLMILLCVSCSLSVFGVELAHLDSLSLGNSPKVIVQDDVLIVLDGTLSCYSITDRFNPVFLGSLSLDQDGLESDLALTGTVAWTVDRKGLLAIDIADPSNPRILSQTRLSGGDGFRVDVLGSVAVVAHTSADPAFDGRDIHVLNVEDPASPVLLASLGSFPAILDVAIRGHCAYVTCRTGIYEGQLVVLDLTDPALPVVGDPVTVGFVREIERCTSGLAAVTESALFKLDTSDPMHPVKLTEHPFYTGGTVFLSVQGDIVTVTYGSATSGEADGVAQLDVSGPNPVLLKDVLHLGDEESYGQLDVGADGIGYFVQKEWGIPHMLSSVVCSDLNDAAPVSENVLPADKSAANPTLDGNQLQVDCYRGMMQFDIGQPSEIRLSGVVGTGDSKTVFDAGTKDGSATIGNLQVLGDLSLQLYDVSVPGSPSFLGEMYDTFEPIGVTASEDTFFLTNFKGTVSSWRPVDDASCMPVSHVANNASVWKTYVIFNNPVFDLTVPMVRLLPPGDVASQAWLSAERLPGMTSTAHLMSAAASCGRVINVAPMLSAKLVFINLEEAGGGVAEFWLDGATSTDLTLMLPRYHAEHLTWTGFALMNTGDTETEATLHIVDADSVDLGSTTIPIPATDRIVGYVQDYFPSVAIADGARITVTADQSLSGLTISGRENRQLLFTPAAAIDQPLTLQIPHIATALDYWDSMLIVDNTAAVARNITIQLYEDGVAQAPIDHVVEAGSQDVFPLGGAVPEATVDCGTITVDGAGVIIREVFVSNPEKGTAEFLPGGQLGSRLVFSFPWYAKEQTAIDWMGLAVMNATDHTLPITAYAYNRDGELLALSHHSLGAMTRFVGYVEELVPGATLTDVAMVIVKTDSEEAGLCGLNISGHENERLLFTPAREE